MIDALNQVIDDNPISRIALSGTVCVCGGGGGVQQLERGQVILDNSISRCSTIVGPALQMVGQQWSNIG